MVTVMACQSIAQTATKSVYGAPVSNYVAILPFSPIRAVHAMHCGIQSTLIPTWLTADVFD